MDAADLILEARRAKRVLAPLGAAAPKDLDAGYAAQRMVAERTGAIPPFGFKIGATTKQMQDYLGLSGPAAGFVPASSPHADGTALRFADYLHPGVECEVGLRLARDIPFGADAGVDDVAEVFPAIEVVEKRYGDLGALGTPTLVADCVFHAAGVLGAAPPSWRAVDLAAIRGELRVEGTLRGRGVGRARLGQPRAALRWLAKSPAAREFGGLRAGQVVWLGSVTPPIWLEGPCRVEVEFEALGKVGLAFT